MYIHSQTKNNRYRQKVFIVSVQIEQIIHTKFERTLYKCTLGVTRSSDDVPSSPSPSPGHPHKPLPRPSPRPSSHVTA